MMMNLIQLFNQWILNSSLAPFVLLIIANVFMTFAWYGHLKNTENHGMWYFIFTSWIIAFFEYCFQVPANRIGQKFYSVAQLKISQEVITMIVFFIFSYFYLNQAFRWNHAVAAGCLVLAVLFVNWPT